jgi:hypothetical protein
VEKGDGRDDADEEKGEGKVEVDLNRELEAGDTDAGEEKSEPDLTREFWREGVGAVEVGEGSEVLISESRLFNNS